MKDRWLLASNTPPWGGTFSVPVMIGRQSSLLSGATTPWLMAYERELIGAPRR